MKSSQIDLTRNDRKMLNNLEHVRQQADLQYADHLFQSKKPDDTQTAATFLTSSNTQPQLINSGLRSFRS